jgi:cephalosporin-C deacetylase-like acetyl esterase
MKLWTACALAAMGAAMTAAGAAELNFKPINGSGIYAVGEKVGWVVTPAAGATTNSLYSYSIRSNAAVEIGKGTLDLSNGGGEIVVTLDHPGMVYVTIDRAPTPGPTPQEAAQINATLKAVVTKKDKALKPIFAKYPDLCLISQPCADKPAAPANLPPIQAHLAIVGAAVAPSKIAPSAARPADFDAFWAGKLAELAKVPVNPVLTEIPAPLPGIKFYKVKLDSLNSHVQGYLAVPDKKGPFPAMVQYQWAGVYALIPFNCAIRAQEGWLCLNVDSHDMAPDTADGTPKNYNEIGNTSRETSYFLNMYLRDTRALDWLRSRPEWNKKVMLVTGTSMGGHQSLVTAGLNPGKITAVLVNEPSGGDSQAELNGRRPAYPNWSVSNPAVAETARYFDTANFAAKITAPTLATIGFIDTVCPPASVLSAVNQIPAPHEIIPMTESEHNNYTPDKQGAWLQRSEEIFATLLHGGSFTPDETIAKAP